MAVERLPRNQLDLLAEMAPKTIPMGCDIPIELFVRYIGSMHSRVISEFGAGAGEKTRLVKEALQAVVLAADINNTIETAGYQKGFSGFTADVRSAEIFHGFGSAILMETQAAAYMEGVLCNQRGDEWKRILEAASIVVAPNGYILIADIFRIDTPNTEFEKRFRNTQQHQKKVRHWQERYKKNLEAAQALGLEIQDNEFMVAKMGRHKPLEWGSPRELGYLYASEYFERWAQHLEYIEVTKFLTDELKLTIVEDIPAVFKSRRREPLNGRVLVAQKGDRYHYHPWFKGCTDEERAAVREEMDEHVNSLDYWDEWVARLKKNIPNAHHHFPLLFQAMSKKEKL